MKDLILRGPPPAYSRIEKGVGQYFFEQAEIYGEKTFQIDGDRGTSESYLFVKQRSTRIALYLKKINIKPKDIVMICCRNNTHNIIPALAGLYLGAYISSLDPKQGVSDVKHAIGLVEPKVMFVEEDSLPLVSKSLEDFHDKPKIIVIGKSDKYVQMSDLEVENEEEGTFKPIKQKGSDISAIAFTSGTTSEPKGVYLSNSIILNNCEAMLQHNHVHPKVLNCLLHFSSLYWISAWVYTALCIRHGMSKVVLSSTSAKQFLQLVDKFKISYVFTSNTFTYDITNLGEEVIKKYDTSSLYCICIAGSTMDPNQILRLRKFLPNTYVALGYGSTEGGYLVCHDFSNKKGYEERVSSSGTVLPERELKFVDMKTGKLLGPNQEGEIRSRCPYQMSGYYNFSKPDTFDEDGFYTMGDIGYYDEDHYVYVTDRISETFKYRTTQISPTLIDNILLTHPGVAEAVSFGVPHPVDRFHAAACVVVKDGIQVGVGELLDFVNDKVSDAYKLRAGIRLVDHIPKTPTGKIQRRSVRDLFKKIAAEKLRLV